MARCRRIGRERDVQVPAPHARRAAGEARGGDGSVGPQPQRRDRAPARGQRGTGSPGTAGAAAPRREERGEEDAQDLDRRLGHRPRRARAHLCRRARRGRPAERRRTRSKAVAGSGEARRVQTARRLREQRLRERGVPGRRGRGGLRQPGVPAERNRVPADARGDHRGEEAQVARGALPEQVGGCRPRHHAGRAARDAALGPADAVVRPCQRDGRRHAPLQRERVQALHRRRGRRRLAHEQRARRAAELEGAVDRDGLPVDRLAPDRSDRRDGQHDLRRHRRAQRLERQRGRRRSLPLDRRRQPLDARPGQSCRGGEPRHRRHRGRPVESEPHPHRYGRRSARALVDRGRALHAARRTAARAVGVA